ncbi:MAG: hypothetical protein FWC80_00590 [Firmicutes bacterium]|nr:hypothetical protein [Bacillota bacterium]
MKFEKKLIMLKGLDYDCKGTVTMEKNASTLKCLINTYDLENLDDGEYFLAVRALDLPCQMRPLGSLGKISTRFDLPPGLDIDDLHCVVAQVGKNVEPVMYGTLSPNKLWRGNMFDGLQRVKGGWLIGGNGGEVVSETFGEEEKQPNYAALTSGSGEVTSPSYSKGKLTDYFLDIVPEKAAEPYGSLYSSGGYRGDEGQGVTSASYQGEVAAAGNWSQQSSGNLTDLAQMYDDSAVAEVNYFMEETADYIPPDLPQGYAPPDYGYTGRSSQASNPRPSIRQTAEEQSRVASSEVRGSGADPRGTPSDYSQVSLRGGNADEAISRVTPTDLYRGYIQSAEPAVPKKSIKDGIEHPAPKKESVDPIVVPPPVSLKAQPDSPPNQNQSHNNGAVNNDTVTTQVLNPAYAIPTIKTYSASSAKSAARTARVKPLSFFDKTRDQIESLFDKYPKEDRLKSLIEDSRWVKVDWDNRGRHYVVGIIGQGPEYIVYGVPAKYSPEPPKELDGYCQWLPLDPKEPQKEGYWLMFQDAKTGESIMKD